MATQDPCPLVFIVDDDATIVRTIAGILGRSGFKTASASNLSDAMQAIRAQPPDLILLDVHLPDGSGLELCRSLRSEAPEITAPVLFLSASEDTLTKIRGFEVGGVDYITKPIVGLEVLARVRTHIRLKRSYERLNELQAERIERLASAQMALMPLARQFPEARFEATIRQVLSAGGDFYDVIPCGEGSVDYMVADASGHDLAASFWTASLKALAMEYAGPLLLPEEIVRSLNCALRRILPPGAFFTLLYARVNHRTRQVSLVNAGHPPPLIVRKDAGEIVRQEGDVLGAFPDAVFGITHFTLRPGDRLFLFTDGLIESGQGYDEGLRRVAETCVAMRDLSLSDLVPAVVDEIVSGCQPADDILLLGVEC